MINLTAYYGPLIVNMWHSASIQIKSLELEQFRVTTNYLFFKFIDSILLIKLQFIFEPIRGNSKEYASISIDNIEIVEGDCG